MIGTRGAAIAMTMVCAVGIVCQFLQRTDPRFPLAYFTVGSALLATCASAALLVAPRAGGRLLLAASPSVLLSALVFATVIAPSQNGGPWFAPHDDAFARIAIATMHGILPLLAILVVRLDGEPLLRRPTTAWVRASLLWPVAYGVGTGVVQATGWAQSPYPFLRPSAVGWATVATAVAGAPVVLAVLAVGLRWITAAGRR